MTTRTLGLEAHPRHRSDTDWLTHPYRSGIDGLEAPLGPLDDDEKRGWPEGLTCQTYRARAISVSWHKGNRECRRRIQYRFRKAFTWREYNENQLRDKIE